MTPPTPQQVAAARSFAKLSVTKAAQTVHCSPRAWRYWESGEEPMHPSKWELFLLKTGQPSEGKGRN